MTLKDIAFRNLRRRWAKAGFVLAGLLIGVATVITLVSLVDVTNNDIQHKLEKYGANILITPKTENLSLTYGGLSLGGVSFEMQEIQQDDLKKIESIKNARNVAAVGPMVLGAIDIGERKVLMAGIDFEATEILKPWWEIEGSIPQTDDVVLGAEVARLTGLTQGRSIDVNGRTLTVTGILKATGSQDDQLVFTKLETAQGIFNMEGRISMAEVAALCSACPINDMVKQISAAIPGSNVMAIQQVVKGRMAALGHFRKFSIGLSAIVMLVGGLVVLVTMMGSVRERTGEIGIFRAIGFRRSHVVRVIFLEAAIISAVAGIAGYFLGYGATRLFIPFFTESQTVAVPFNLTLAAASVLLAIFLGLASTIYPALMAARLDPNEALRAL